jgi:fructuronate reductase
MQIAADGSLKLPPRLLGTIADRITAGASYKRLTLAVAGWMRFLLQKSDAGATYAINDPMASKLTELVARSQGVNASIMEHLLAVREIFPPGLAEHAGFRHELAAALEGLSTFGARKTIARYA